ncbi:MAG: VPLPA-CTERM sorting domain-containing protein [Deltaproteobacteria bacterium]|nr:VPLPA-CTERM sorting domain-containing protein [Deltaproteobacteria bacterium]
MFKRGKILILILGVLFLLCPSLALAHDATIEDPFELSLNEEGYVEHTDDGPYKGTLTLSIKNKGIDPWGDFHFYSNTEGVIFGEDEGLPTMTGAASYSYTIDPDQKGLHFYFYDDPVYTGEQVSFSLYTDNTSMENAVFNISFEPSPIPVPAAVWLLGSGLIGLVGLRKKSR